MVRPLICTALAAALCHPHFSAADMPAVVVTATRQQLRANDLLSDTAIIDREQIEHAGAATLIDLLSRQAGVDISTNGGPGSDSSLYIRGANGGHTLLLVDGVRVGAATTGAPIFSTLPLSAVDHIEIVRGPASALYGPDAIGGVVQIFTRKGKDEPRLDAFAGYGSYGTHRLEAGIASSSGPLSFNGRVGRFRSAGKDALASPPDRDGFEQDSASGRLGLDLPERGELALSVFASNGVSHFDDGTLADSRNAIKSRVSSVQWRQPFGSRWTSTLTAAQSFDQSTAYDSNSDNRFQTERNQLSWQNDVSLAAGMALLAVETVTEQVLNANTALATTWRKSDAATAGWHGRFGDHRVQINARRELGTQFGAQNNHFAAYGYQITERLRAHASVATAFKAPTFNDLYFPVSCFGIWGCFGGNPNLRPERAKNREAALVWEDSGKKLGITHFDNKVADLIEWGNTPSNVGVARLRGTTLEAASVGTLWNVAAALSQLDARNEATQQRLIRRAPHKFTFRADRSIGHWRTGADLTLVSQRPDRDFNSGSDVQLGGYGLLGLYASTPLERGLTLELRADNLGDKRYQNALNFMPLGRSLFVGLRYTMN